MGRPWSSSFIVGKTEMTQGSTKTKAKNAPWQKTGEAKNNKKK